MTLQITGGRQPAKAQPYWIVGTLFDNPVRFPHPSPVAKNLLVIFMPPSQRFEDR
jgi:hypothetical protein